MSANEPTAPAPSDLRPLAEHDLDFCRCCGAPATRWADGVLGRAEGRCAEHADAAASAPNAAAGDDSRIRAVQDVVDGLIGRAQRAQSCLREAWLDLGKLIDEADRAPAAAEADRRLTDHHLAWVIGQIAANEGADLTVAAIADAIGADRAAGHPWPDIDKLDRFFDEEDPALDAAHPALCKLLDDALT